MKQILILLCGLTICTLFVPHDAFAKSLSIELSESLDIAANDKKKDTDKKDDKKKDKKKSDKKEKKKQATKKLTKSKGKPLLKTKQN